MAEKKSEDNASASKKVLGGLHRKSLLVEE
jgi:hypothetical protein